MSNKAHIKPPLKTNPEPKLCNSKIKPDKFPENNFMNIFSIFFKNRKNELFSMI